MEGEEEKEKEKDLPIKLVQVPTDFGLAFETPEGQMDANTYLAWLGNLVLEIKEGLVGK